ncbi:MAG: hypothetical protein PHW42_05495 [Patescibacteria group bacterium]|nr:hypothetical protein [Patescibacteria group bacterium]
MEEKKYLVIDGEQTRIEDLTGRKVGVLTVIGFDIERYNKFKEKVKNKKAHKDNLYYWLCTCECDKNKILSIKRSSITQNRIQSCGCLTNTIISTINSKPVIMSFEQWCIKNNKQDYLDLWDYNLNNKIPSEVGYKSTKKFYFKCCNGIHESELKQIDVVVSSNNRFKCKKCNSFAQFGINNFGESFLEDYWDYDKNKLNPWEIAQTSHKKVWIKCKNDVSHCSYYIACENFKIGRRCPACKESKGEKEISKFLINNNIKYIFQKEYNRLIGLGGCNLRFDFSIPSLNINIEFDGEGHFKPIDFNGEGIEIAKEKFEILKCHDKLKNEYCKKYKIKLIRIPYWDFDNIEEILKKELKLN